MSAIHRKLSWYQDLSSPTNVYYWTSEKIQKKEQEDCTETFVETTTERESAVLPCNSSSAPQLQQTVLRLLSVTNQMSQTPSTLSSSTPRQASLRRKLHWARVVSSLRKKRLAIADQRLFLLRKRYCVKNVMNSSVESIFNAVKPMLSSNCLKWLEEQLRMAKRCPRGRRYNDNSKQFALNLYCHGPKVYRFPSCIFILPLNSTLSAWLQSMQVCPGVSDDLMHATSIRVEGLQDRHRVCG